MISTILPYCNPCIGESFWNIVKVKRMKQFKIERSGQVREGENQQRFKERLCVIIIFFIFYDSYCSFLFNNKGWRKEEDVEDQISIA
jgi:hypothetical protein